MLEDFNKTYLPTTKEKVFFWVGAVSFVTAIILIAFAPPVKIDMRLWTVSAILAASSFVYYLHYVWMVPSKINVNQTCVDANRDRALVFCVFFVLVALLLHYSDKYEDFTVSMCPEIILVAISVVCWRFGSFFPTNY